MKPPGTPALETTVIKEGDALRDIAETFIRNAYAAQPLPTGVPSASHCCQAGR
jgi:hypothetical protein